MEYIYNYSNEKVTKINGGRIELGIQLEYIDEEDYSMEKKRLWVHLAILTTVVLWGISFISIKIVVDVLPPMTFALIRFMIASVILLIIFKIKEPKTRLAKKDIPLMMLGGFIGVTLYFYFENYGIQLTTASVASIIIATIPIFSLIAEAIVFKSKLTLKKIIGVIVSVIGVYFIIGGNVRELISSNSRLGYIMMFAAVFAWVVYSLVTKPLFDKYSQLAIVYYQTIFGTIFLTPFVLFESPQWNLINSSIILNVIYLGVFCSALAYYLYVYALDHLGISVSSLYLNVIPLVTIIGSYFILHERIHGNQIFGGILVVLSVYLVSWQSSAEENMIKDKILPMREY